ncbi:probable phosphatidylinositol 4-phosphate 5-kinase 8 at N-terminal half [Coccomyxa sp. Obi]|nr:probable phosphatidylinositol 4-phosphate 5-kinase 8 at N-terminal half [Coccomyxa sp. Obi]
MSEEQRHPLEPKAVGKGLDAHRHSPLDPQSYLAGSQHPYSPFPGNALKWDSVVYDDGTTYEGLTREGVPHGKGVMVFGNGVGAGFQRAKRGERYEGEFAFGFAHGLGMHTGVDGEIYRGEYLLGKRHGCGAVVDMQPYYKQVAKGVNPTEAWESTLPQIKAGMQYGTWKKDLMAGSSGSSRFCPLPEVQGTLQEVEEVLTRARMFQYKPDGDVTFMAVQDAKGIPISTFQDPLHYPHNTKFLAPGPLGQCHPIPDSAEVREQMLKHARNYERIYRSYNLPYQSAPGSDMAKAIDAFKAQLAAWQKKLKRIQELEQRRLRRLERRSGVKPDAPKEEEAGRGRGRGRQPPQPVEDEDDGDIDNEDLIASTSGMDSPTGASSQHTGAASNRWGGLPPPTAFASVSLGMHRAMTGFGCFMEHLAQRAQRRRCLTRPRH